MALRFANKIHCLVNNVVAQGLRLQAHALKANAPSAPPKTRYPLNQQDANSYIEQLRARAFACPRADAQGADVVRCFSVNVCTRPTKLDTRQQQQQQQQLSNGQMTVVQRCLATKAGKPPKKKSSGEWNKDPKCKDGGKKVDCKKGPAAEADKCPKMEDDGCTKFKIETCKQSEDPNCAHRKYIFTECKKPLAPYPSFSEACYEALPPDTSECKLCPWDPSFKHPTFKPPMNKFASPDYKKGGDKGGNKRKFHTDAARMITLRFGAPGRTERDRRAEELEDRPHAIRPNYYARKRLAEMYVRAPRIVPARCAQPPRKFAFKPLPEDQCLPPVKFRTDVTYANMAEERIKAEEARMEQTLVKLENMILAKNRVRVTGPPLCGKNECGSGNKTMKKKKCTKKTKIQICPVDLLDRKPYKKFREGKKKRAKKHKKRHRKHHKRGRRGGKRKNKHGCAAALAPATVDDGLGEMSPALLRSMTARHVAEQQPAV